MKLIEISIRKKRFFFTSFIKMDLGKGKKNTLKAHNQNKKLSKLAINFPIKIIYIYLFIYNEWY